MIISLHMPKSGGSSFKKILYNQFKRGLQLDYKDHPIEKSINERIKQAENKKYLINLYKRYLYSFFKVKCIHGHFLPYKYSDLVKNQNTVFITWLRDPLERLGSHYYYWKRLNNMKTSSTLYRKILEDNLSLKDFCFSEDIRNIYSKFLYKFPIENFNFIGITEYYNDDVKYFFEYFLNIEGFEVPISNANPGKHARYFKDTTLINDLKEFHSTDYELYNYALNKRNKRLN